VHTRQHVGGPPLATFVRNTRRAFQTSVARTGAFTTGEGQSVRPGGVWTGGGARRGASAAGRERAFSFSPPDGRMGWSW
jgi:hypothetical protein